MNKLIKKVKKKKLFDNTFCILTYEGTLIEEYQDVDFKSPWGGNILQPFRKVHLINTERAMIFDADSTTKTVEISNKS